MIVKQLNYGKRDSLVLVRRMCNLYNNRIHTHDLISTKLINNVHKFLKKIYINNIDYIIGIDADTIFDYNCTYQLINTIDNGDCILVYIKMYKNV